MAAFKMPACLFTFTHLFEEFCLVLLPCFAFCLLINKCSILCVDASTFGEIMEALKIPPVKSAYISRHLQVFVDSFSRNVGHVRGNFARDITECIDFLVAQINALSCDLEGLGGPTMHSTDVTFDDFSKAHSEVICGVQSFINEKERVWLDEISELKQVFVTNVGKLLTYITRGVQLPSSEASVTVSRQDSSDCSESSANDTGSSDNEGITVDNPVQSRRRGCSADPSLNLPGSQMITHDEADGIETISDDVTSGKLEKKVPVSQNKEITGPRRACAPRSKPAVQSVPVKDCMVSSECSVTETGTVGAQVQSNGKGRSSIELRKPPSVSASISQNESSDSYDSSENEALSGELKVQASRRGRSSVTSIKLSSSQMLTHEETEGIALDTDHDVSGLLEKNVPVSQNGKVTRSRRARGQRSKHKQVVQNGPASLPSTSKKLPVRCSQTQTNDDIQSSKCFSGDIEVKEVSKQVNIQSCILPCFGNLYAYPCSRGYCFMVPWQLGTFCGSLVESEFVIFPCVPVVSSPPLMIMGSGCCSDY